MKALVLVGGTGSVCRVVRGLGYDVVSIDDGSGYIKKKALESLGAIVTDIMTWDNKRYKHLDLI